MEVATAAAGSPLLRALLVATPPADHARMACAALEAGKHVLIEKPLALTLADARRIQALQAQSGRVATVDYMLR